MEENSIEETKKQLELILKVRKEQKEIIECAGGSCINCDPDIKALSKSIEILSDYKRVLKENEELKRLHIQDNKHLDFIMEHSISVQKVKDKIEELNEELEIMKVDNMYGRYKEYGGKSKWERLFLTKYGMHDALQELLEGRK